MRGTIDIDAIYDNTMDQENGNWQGLRKTIATLALLTQCVPSPVVMAAVLTALVLMAPASIIAVANAADTEQESFESAEAGVAALVAAVKSNDQALMISILGSHSSKLISSGDAVADAQNRERFISAFGDAHRVVPDGEEKATLLIGADEWPMPIPLVKSEGRWRFDSAQGKKEILARRIGANELSAIKVCRAIVDTQREYAAQRSAATAMECRTMRNDW